MKKRAIFLFLAVIMIFTACSSSTTTEVSISKIKRQEFGNAMPQMLFADKGKVTFWGEMGLFVVNTSDGSIYRSLDLSAIDSNSEQGSNHVAGSVITQFWVSFDKTAVYFTNTGEDVAVSPKGIQPHMYKIEEDKVTENMSGDLEIAPEAKAISAEYVGGEPKEQYMSNIVINNPEQKAYYLKASDWSVNKLTLVEYNLETDQENSFLLFG